MEDKASTMFGMRCAMSRKIVLSARGRGSHGRLQGRELEQGEAGQGEQGVEVHPSPRLTGTSLLRLPLTDMHSW